MSRGFTSKLHSHALTYAVAKALGYQFEAKTGWINRRLIVEHDGVKFEFNPLYDKSQWFAIIESERINFKNDGLTEGEWWAFYPNGNFTEMSESMVLAGLRCVVHRHLGRVVDLPLDLVSLAL